MRVVPEQLLADVYQCFLRGSLARLAMHPSANFVVQAYLAALHASQQVRYAVSMCTFCMESCLSFHWDDCSIRASCSAHAPHVDA